MLCAVAAALGTVAAVDLHFRDRLEAIEQQASEAHANFDLHRAAAAERDELAGRQSEIGALIEELERIRDRNRTVQDWLAALSDSLPRGLRLTRLAISGNAWEIQGVAPGLDEAAQFVGVLRAMPVVAEVRVENLRSGAVQSRQILLTGAFRE